MDVTLILSSLFWVGLIVLLYVFVGYPLTLSLLVCLLRKTTSPHVASQLPRVSLVISAFNEQSVIRAKIENTLTLDYPSELLDVMVISDCSDDDTDQIVGTFQDRGVRLVRLGQRVGKSAGLNLGIPQTRGDILLFSDSNAMYCPNVIRLLVRHFALPDVGYVVGNQRYLECGTQSGQSEGMYWKLETWLKQKESEFNSVVGGDGAIYAIRRDLYSPLQPTDINDFLNPLQIINRGYRGVFEPAAICYEEAAETFSQEFGRKTRIVGRSLRAVFQVPGVLNPFKNPRHWFMLVSHKILRWFAPFFMLLLLASSLALWQSTFFRLIAVLQLGFYALAMAGRQLSQRDISWKPFYLPYYFCLVNWASLVGVAKYLRGDLSGIWTTVRQHNTQSDAGGTPQ